MTAEEFLKLADQLDKRINAKLKEIDGIRKLLYGVSATSMEESYNATKNTTAPYVRNIEKIMLMENEINEEIDKLVDLKIAVSKAIDALPNATFSLILRYRYILAVSIILPPSTERVVIVTLLRILSNCSVVSCQTSV